MQHAQPIPFEPQVIRSKLELWFTQYARALPWRENPSPYAVLVSEFMLQQTQVTTVIPYFQRWMSQLPTIQTLAAAQESDVLKLWQGLGYYSRARNLHASARKILTDFQGNIPSNPLNLQKLPGVGHYTAGAIAAFAFDLPVPAIDANIARVLARLTDFQHPIDTPSGLDALTQTAKSLLPQTGKGGRALTGALMELGALVCSPKRPRCEDCPIRSECKAADPERLPIKSPKKKTVSLVENALWILAKDSVLLTQQIGKRSHGLWKLPSPETPPETPPIFETIYPFTHHRITLRVFNATPPHSLAPQDRWFPIATVLEDAPLPAAHRRALTTLLHAHSQPPTHSTIR